MRVRLILCDARMAESLRAGAATAAFEAGHGVTVGDQAAFALEVLDQTLPNNERRPRDPSPGGYLVVDASTHVVVGTGGFRDGASSDGSVELAYGTFPPFEGRGYATETARALIATASARTEVRRIIAHTLPVAGPSPRILEKIGMRRVGEVIDPEDGPVWEFETAPVRT